MRGGFASLLPAGRCQALGLVAVPARCRSIDYFRLFTDEGVEAAGASVQG